MNLSVVCAEYWPLTSPAQLAMAQATLSPQFARVFNADQYALACPRWGVPAAPKAESAPVSSDVPALVLAGSFDPITPPSWGRHVAETLSHAHYVEFAAGSHGVTLTPCGLQTVAGFFDAPDTFAAPHCPDRDSDQVWTRAMSSQP